MNLLMVHITKSYKDTLPARQSDRHSPNIRRWRLAKLSQFALKFMNILITASSWKLAKTEYRYNKWQKYKCRESKSSFFKNNR